MSDSKSDLLVGNRMDFSAADLHAANKRKELCELLKYSAYLKCGSNHLFVQKVGR